MAWKNRRETLSSRNYFKASPSFHDCFKASVPGLTMSIREDLNILPSPKTVPLQNETPDSVETPSEINGVAVRQLPGCTQLWRLTRSICGYYSYIIDYVMTVAGGWPNWTPWTTLKIGEELCNVIIVCLAPRFGFTCTLPCIMTSFVLRKGSESYSTFETVDKYSVTAWD